MHIVACSAKQDSACLHLADPPVSGKSSCHTAACCIFRYRAACLCKASCFQLWSTLLLCCYSGQRHRAQIAVMQQQDKAFSPKLQSTVSTPSPASPEEQAGSSSDSVARPLPSPLAQLAGQAHPQSGDADDVRSHAAQLASVSNDSSPDAAVHKGMPSCALPCFALSCLALPSCLACPCPCPCPCPRAYLALAFAFAFAFAFPGLMGS